MGSHNSLIDFVRVPTSCRNMLRVSRAEWSELMTGWFIINAIKRVSIKGLQPNGWLEPVARCILLLTPI